MFKFFLPYILVLLPFFSVAQKPGSITIIGDADMHFNLYLDNVKQNDSNVTQIRIDGLTDLWYMVKAVNKDTLYFSRNLLVRGMDTEPVDVTYRVKRLSNGKVRVTLYSMFAPDPGFKEPAGMFVTKIKLPAPNVEQEAGKPIIVEQKKGDKITEANYGDSKNNEVVLKTKKKPAKNSTNNPEIKTPAVINSKISSDNKGVNNKVEEKGKTEVKNKGSLKKCNGWPITKKDFDLMMKTILESKTEAIKLKNAKSLITGSCFLVSQLDDITALFKNEESKLEFVKFAYNYTIDRPNYYKLEKYFSSTKSKEEFSSIHGE